MIAMTTSNSTKVKPLRMDLHAMAVSSPKKVHLDRTRREDMNPSILAKMSARVHHVSLASRRQLPLFGETMLRITAIAAGI
jgi:hypothetical protein